MTELGLIAIGYLLSWPGLGAILLLGVLAEHYSCTKWAVFLALVAGIVAYTMFNVPLATLAIAVGAYAVTGFLWSFWRYTRFVKSGVKNMRFSTDQEKARKINDLSPKENLGSIVRWVLIWPLSLAGCVVGDVINLVQRLVSETFRKIYAKIFTSYTKDL